MFTSAYPKTHLVKGISPEFLNGSESTILRPAFFIDVDGKLHWTAKNRWKMEHLRPVKGGDERFILNFDEDDYIGINEGENLYLMGEQFYEAVTKLIDDGLIEFSLHAWHPTVHGYRAAVMTRCAFDAFRASLSYEIWPIVENFIVTGFSSQPDISEVFDTYDRLITHDEHEKQIHALRSGAFFKALGDADRFTFFSWGVVRSNVREGSFASQEEFEQVLDRYMHSLKTLRAGQLT
jgi:hypothetical protein